MKKWAILPATLSLAVASVGMTIPQAAATEVAPAATLSVQASAEAEQDTELTRSEALDAKDQLAQIEQQLEVEVSTAPTADYAKEIRNLLDTVGVLVTDLTKFAAGDISSVDLESITTRIELVEKIAETIQNSTENLTAKVQAAHVELGFGVTRAILMVIDLGADASQLQASIDELDQIYDRVSAYPELTPNDRATIYVKANLDKKIWETRIDRDQNILGKVPFQTYNQLNRHITKAVGVWFNATATVADVQAAMDDLDQAYATAAADLEK